MPYLFQLVRSTEKIIAGATPTRHNYEKIVSILHFLMDHTPRSSTAQLFVLCMMCVLAKRIIHQRFLFQIHTEFLAWIDHSVVSRGCLYDCGFYDSLDYQVEGLLLAALLHNLLLPYTHTNYRRYKTRQGQSLHMAQRYLEPYLTGERLHLQYLYPMTPLSHMPRRWRSSLRPQDIRFDRRKRRLRIGRNA